MKRAIILFPIVLLLLIGLTTVTAHRQRDPSAPQADFDLSWYSVDGGASFSSGGSYSLGGTIGQPDAGALIGGNYTLGGGFWGGGQLHSALVYAVYLPTMLR